MYGKVKKGTPEKGTKKTEKQISRAIGVQVLIHQSKEIGYIVRVYDAENILVADAAGFYTEAAAREYAEEYLK